MPKNSLTILGTGTMGAGIAQVAATHGWTVYLHDITETVVNNAIAGITRHLDRLVEKKRLTPDEHTAAVNNLSAGNAESTNGCDLIIEAVVECLDLKIRILNEFIPHLTDEAIIATNTSALSITELGDRLNQPHRVVGMHFFNPAPLMKLVEVIPGERTTPVVTERVCEIAVGWGKQVARAADVPGFIVNHVARPYYLEAFRILEAGYATPAEIDQALKSVGRFRMGPFELTDLIGHDINAETTRQVYRAVGKPALLKPSPLQEQLVADNHLGRKTKRGIYDYSTNPKHPTPALQRQKQTIPWTDNLSATLDVFIANATKTPGTEFENYIFARILTAIITQANAAHQRGIATKDDIDTALRCGVNYPRGPFQWEQEIGIENVDNFRKALKNSRK